MTLTNVLNVMAYGLFLTRFFYLLTWRTEERYFFVYFSLYLTDQIHIPLNRKVHTWNSLLEKILKYFPEILYLFR